ncbi:hypothetical protein CDAR_411161 [Caerostris darwini]|uniref:Uncharacterized protein n=1 Tax=Caerostris darwini TaxID=1538125 RepID=A0AAV4SII2_9ARAC|nr:hypothetical protein CDAR_411161 [Caerostris darwini]
MKANVSYWSEYSITDNTYYVFIVVTIRNQSSRDLFCSFDLFSFANFSIGITFCLVCGLASYVTFCLPICEKKSRLL